MRISRLATASLLAIAALLAPTDSWAADSDSPTTAVIQERINDLIEEYGGTQTAWNEVTWDDGDVVLTLAPETIPTAKATATAVDDCASARYCVYSKTNYNGDKISYSACPATYTSFPALSGPIRSIRNDLNSGTIRAYNGSTLTTTLAPNNGTTSVTGITKVTCS